MSNRLAKAREFGLELVPATSTPLLAFSASRDIPTYSESSIDAYKRRMLAEHMPDPFLQRVSDVIAVLGFTLLSMTLLVVLGAVMCYVADRSEGFFYLLTVAGALMMCGIPAWCVALKLWSETLTPFWREHYFDSYIAQHEAPREIVERALMLQRRFPRAVVKVHDLAFTPDPILTVQLNEELYGVGVWDEPSFDAKPLC